MQANDSTKDARSEASAAKQDNPVHREIRVKGHLDTRWAAWFDGLSLTNENDGTTTIQGPVGTKPHCTACCKGCATSECRCSRSPRPTRPHLLHPSSILDELEPEG